MTDTLEYNGYTGSVEYSAEDECLYGKLQNIRDLVNYEAEDVKSLKAEFEAAVDDYLVTCDELGKAADKPYKGTFNVRTSPKIHRDLDLLAARTGESLNLVVGKGLEVFTDLAAAIPGEVRDISQVVNEIVRVMDLPEVQVQVHGMKVASRPKAGAKSKTARAGSGRGKSLAKKAAAKKAPRARATAAAKAKLVKQIEEAQAKIRKRKVLVR